MILVSDTSVLLNLAFLGRGDLLATLFGQVLIPEVVEGEFARMSASSGRFAGLPLPTCCCTQRISGLPLQLALDGRLDAGEAEAIALAWQVKASAILLDEINGRDAAKQAGLTVIGTLGLLVTAKQRGLLPEIAPSLRRLIVEASFRVSVTLLHHTLRMTGELP